MTELRKLVIPTAGYGTRMLPASGIVPKELLPIGTVPAIYFLLWEAAEAGIDTVVLVNAAWKTSLDHILDLEPELVRKVRGTNLDPLISWVEQLRARIQVVSVLQPGARGLGHAVQTAMPIIGDEPFAVALPDELILQTPNVLQSLVAAAGSGHGAVALQQVPRELAGRYGIADLGGLEPPATIRALVEKPRPDQAPSNWAVVGRYIFPAGYRHALDNLRPGNGGELQLTDAMADHLGTFPLVGVEVTGRRYDTGSPEGYGCAWRDYLADPSAFHRAVGLA